MNINFIKLYRRLKFIGRTINFFLLNIFTSITSRITHNATNTIETKGGQDTSANFAFLGLVYSDIFNEEARVAGLNKALDYPDAIFCYADQEIPTINSTNLFNVANLDDSIIDIGGHVKVGCAVFRFDENDDMKNIQYRCLKKLKQFNRSGATFCIAYVDIVDETVGNPGSIKKTIGRTGFDCVFGAEEKIKSRRGFMTLNFKETRIMYSLGGLTPVSLLDSTSEQEESNENEPNNELELEGTNEAEINSFELNCNNYVGSKIAVAYRIMVRKDSKKVNIVKEGFIPLHVKFTDGKVEKITDIPPTYAASENLEGRWYRLTEYKMNTLRNWHLLITMRDILGVIGESFPDKYKNLADYSVNRICARTYELQPGNIFFFRRNFADKNDTKREFEFMRNRLIVRALTRKTLFTFSYKSLGSLCPHMVIKDPMEAHIKVMAWYREKFLATKFIGVTGSVGKTSTKDMLYCVLDEEFHAGKNIRNTNVQVKIGINLQKIPANCDIYVQEIGGGRPGGASRHSRMVLPEAAIVTNIGTAHIGNYDSQEDLMNNKIGIIEGMRGNGVLFLNGDDPLLLKAKPNCNVVYYALNNKKADYYADNILDDDGVTYFDVIHNDEVVKAKINVLGEYNVLNAVCAFAVGRHFGMKYDNILTGLTKFKTADSRQNLITVGGYRFFVDCYNASVDSIDSSLHVLSKLKPKEGGKRIAIIGDVTGMGELQQSINDQIIDVLKGHKPDEIVCYGDNAEYIGSKLRESRINAISIIKPVSLESWMSTNITKGDVTLLKGSSKVKLDERLDDVFGLNLADQRYIDEAMCTILRKHKMKCRIFHEYASLIKYTGHEHKVVMRDKVMGRKIRKILPKAFYHNDNLKEVTIAESVAHIGSYAFANCFNLETVNFSNSIKHVDKGAFQNCSNLREIVLGNSVLHIGENAFRGCKSLEKVIIPKNIGFVDIDAFTDCPAKVIYK